MASPIHFSMKDLIEAGVHFGHKTRRWNPKMAPFIYGVRNDTHIIDLNKTVPLLYSALQAAYEVAKAGGRVLFVGTKRQASQPVAEAARHCGQFYVHHRWLGGMLTNWKTIQNSIRRLQDLEEKLQQQDNRYTKKELLNIERQRHKLELSLGGIRGMGVVPDMLVIVDVTYEDLALKEAKKLNIPVAAVVDTNADLDGVSYPVPGNDDATKAIRLYCRLFAESIRQGLQDGGIALPDHATAAPPLTQEELISGESTAGVPEEASAPPAQASRAKAHAMQAASQLGSSAT